MDKNHSGRAPKTYPYVLITSGSHSTNDENSVINVYRRLKNCFQAHSKMIAYGQGKHSEFWIYFDCKRDMMHCKLALGGTSSSNPKYKRSA